MIKAQDSSGRSLLLTVHYVQKVPNGPPDYALRYNDRQFRYTFVDRDQMEWVVDNRPPEFVAWLDSLEELEVISIPSVNYGGIQDDGLDHKYNSKCVCSFQSYLDAIEMGRQSGDMSNYVRVDNMGQPLPRHLQA